MDKSVVEKFKFDDIDDLKRKPEIEAKGAVFGFPGGNGKRWMRVRAATSNNPFWRAQSDRILKQLREFELANAPDAMVKEFLAEKFAALLVVDWGNWEIDGVEIPFSAEACFALLMQTDDVYKLINGAVFRDENFRHERAELVLVEGKA